MCCNGVLFHGVRLQPDDSSQALKALGFRIHYKKKFDFFDQPCPAFKKSCCSIYADRPSRCRIFECQQLKQLAQGIITEATALEKIKEAHCKVDLLQDLLYRLGPTNLNKPLAKQYESIIAEPMDSTAGAEALALRAQLIEAFQNLHQFLNNEFRNEKLPE